MKNPDPHFFLMANIRSILQGVGTRNAPEALTLDGDSLRLLTGFPHPFGNIFLPGKMERESLSGLFREVEDFSRERQAPVALVLFPEGGPVSGTETAQARGWVLLDDMPGMWLDLDQAKPGRELAVGVEVFQADDTQSLQSVISILAEGYPVPVEVADLWMRGIHLISEQGSGQASNFLATVHGQPAACSSVYVEDGVAGVYCVATLEGFRGKGLGEAVTRIALEYGRDQGATHALLHATEMGFPVYQRIGFQTRSKIPVFGFGLG